MTVSSKGGANSEKTSAPKRQRDPAAAMKEQAAPAAVSGGSCDPIKKQQIFEIYQKAARVLHAVYQKRFEQSGCN